MRRVSHFGIINGNDNCSFYQKYLVQLECCWNIAGTGTSDLFGYLKMLKTNSTFNFTIERCLNPKIIMSFSSLTNLRKNQLSYGKIH